MALFQKADGRRRRSADGRPRRRARTIADRAARTARQEARAVADQTEEGNPGCHVPVSGSSLSSTRRVSAAARSSDAPPMARA